MPDRFGWCDLAVAFLFGGLVMLMLIRAWYYAFQLDQTKGQRRLKELKSK